MALFLKMDRERTGCALGVACASHVCADREL